LVALLAIPAGQGGARPSSVSVHFDLEIKSLDMMALNEFSRPIPLVTIPPCTHFPALPHHWPAHIWVGPHGDCPLGTPLPFAADRGGERTGKGGTGEKGRARSERRANENGVGGIRCCK